MNKRDIIILAAFAIVAVYFVFLYNDKPSVMAFSTTGGEILIETENFSGKSGSPAWSRSGSTGGYKGGGYMESGRGGDSHNNTLSTFGTGGYMEYDINFDKTGKYYLHMRSNSSSHSNNGIYVTVDGNKIHGESVRVGEKNGRWSWFTRDQREDVHWSQQVIPTFRINSTGKHVLRIQKRESNVKIDQIFITTDGSAMTDSKVTESQNQGQTTDNTDANTSSYSYCHKLSKSTAIPNGYGASYNTLTSAKELLMKVLCHPTNASQTKIEVGNGEAYQYVYEKGYIWKGGQWQQVNLSGSEKNGIWIVGRASANLNMTNEELQNNNYFVGYVCSWTGSEWKCGCKDSTCTQGYWQLQTFKK